MNRRFGVALSAMLLGIGHVAFAQAAPDARTVPAKDRPALALVVSIRIAWNDAAYVGSTGAGVIVAATSDAIYVATARHVVGRQENDAGGRPVLQVADSVWVTLYDAKAPRLARVVRVDSALLAAGQRRLKAVANDADATRRIAAELENDTSLFAQTNYDLAVVRVARDRGWQPPALDRLGDVSAMRRGDDVTAIGCPGSNCWSPLARGDVFLDVAGARRRVTEFQSGDLTFQTQAVTTGSSGGALMNKDGEVIGIVRRLNRPVGYALPINDVLNLLHRSGLPVDLRRPRVPRDGYHLKFDVDVLAPLNAISVADSLATDTRLPSARLTLSKRGRSSLTWHVGALRLAPYNTSIHAAMGGLGFTQRIGRLSLKPFAELGFGQVRSRHDAGGYYRLPSGVTALPSPSAPFYEPLWVAERASSAGFGAGLHAELIVAPHVSVGANIARWTFGLTPKAPTLPSAFVGGGLRWSR